MVLSEGIQASAGSGNIGNRLWAGHPLATTRKQGRSVLQKRSQGVDDPGPARGRLSDRSEGASMTIAGSMRIGGSMTTAGSMMIAVRLMRERSRVSYGN